MSIDKNATTAVKKQAPKKEETKRYTAKYSRMYHPYQNAYINVGDNALLIVDSWVECQAAAGLLIEVE